MDAIEEFLAGRISAPVAVARMLLGGADAAAVAAIVAAARPATPSPAWAALERLTAGRALDAAAAVVRTGRDQTALGGVAEVAAFFDRAVSASPEAGVALYSLGDPALLAEATAEIVDWLMAGDLLPKNGAVLDLGCGIGRVAAALAPHCREVVGVDVSAGMVAEARLRYGGVPNLRFAVTDGATVLPGRFGLVLAVDSMPYVMQAGAAERVVAGIAASLSPGGSLVVLNLSYGRTAAQDVADAERWAAAHGLVLAQAGAAPFSLWDGSAWVWTKPPAIAAVRRARSADLPGVLALYQELNPGDAVPDRDRAVAAWQGLVGSPWATVFVAEVAGLLAATCTLIVIPNLTRNASAFGVIENVVTHSDHRGTGFGRAVLKAALDHAWQAGCYKVMLASGRGEDTLRFYETSGFKRGGKTFFEARRPWAPLE